MESSDRGWEAIVKKRQARLIIAITNSDSPLTLDIPPGPSLMIACDDSEDISATLAITTRRSSAAARQNSATEQKPSQV